MNDSSFAPLEDWLFSYLMHELRTPLNAALGFSQMLHDGAYGELNEMQRDRLERVVRSSQLLLRRLDLLLDFNRLYHDELDLSEAPVLVGDLLQDVLAASDYDSRGRLLKVILPEATPDVALALNRTWAGVALREVVLHAASEAIPDPSVWINAAVLEPQAVLSLSVRFTGPPMDTWQHGTLFTVRNRSGIGLPLALELLSRMRGKIMYDSVATRHEITLWLPLAQ